MATGPTPFAGAHYTPFREVQLKIRQSYRNPNVGEVSQVVLKEGPRTFKIATVWIQVIVD